METQPNEWEAGTRKNVLHLAYWTGGWVLTVAIAAFGPKLIWDFNSTMSVVAILVNAIVGVGWILMNRKYTNGLDELHRKITMDARAMALGVGVVGGISYSMLDAAKVISFHAEIGHLIGLMGITYLIAFIIDSIRYK